jgi:hypothetical protein
LHAPLACFFFEGCRTAHLSSEPKTLVIDASCVLRRTDSGQRFSIQEIAKAAGGAADLILSSELKPRGRSVIGGLR